MGEYNDEVFETNMQEFFLIVFLENMVKIFFYKYFKSYMKKA